MQIISQKNRNFALRMNRVFHILLAMVAVLMLWGCMEQRTVGLHYNVICQIDSIFGKDSATLLVVQPDYKRLRVLACDSIHDGKFSFAGQLAVPCVAIIKFDSDSVPFYFVLESGNTTITINRVDWIIEGGPLCNSYMRYMNKRQHLKAEMEKTWKAYVHMASDSTLKRQHEEMMFRHDSLMLDSMQWLTVERINRGDLVSDIVRERFINTLDSAHLSHIRR